MPLQPAADEESPSSPAAATPTADKKVIATKVLGIVQWFNVRNGYSQHYKPYFRSGGDERFKPKGPPCHRLARDSEEGKENQEGAGPNQQPLRWPMRSNRRPGQTTESACVNDDRKNAKTEVLWKIGIFIVLMEY
uniref:Uncharacterized protein n=1 Tax=Sparus aurata TaxID=8175 RepID=A0A671YLV4_SPAAU